jgi:hypothetical protein
MPRRLKGSRPEPPEAPAAEAQAGAGDPVEASSQRKNSRLRSSVDGALRDEEFETAEELSAEAESVSPSAIGDLPPSRTLAELYERQGFPEEARQIYDRLAVDPSEEPVPGGPSLASEPNEATPLAAPDPRESKRRSLEAWLSRIRANASAGAR